ncbi:bypass of stop codon protein 1-like, partial [Colossoma macropomum]|uniref:bypass of stop codon protein 1-like n=1 Tax=Colossoma macropomum TaxID=42526 RepID=UPI00186472CC
AAPPARGSSSSSTTTSSTTSSATTTTTSSTTSSATSSATTTTTSSTTSSATTTTTSSTTSSSSSSTTTSSSSTTTTSLYNGSISDQEVTRRSNFTRLLQPGDGVMADKGFQIERMLAEVGATLIIPPFKKSAQFSMEDAEKTQAVARLRVLVERAV